MPTSQRPVGAVNWPRAILAFAIVLACSILIRSIPSLWSPLPYNIDGLSEARLADHILTYGELVFPAETSLTAGYVGDMPLLSLVIAFLCTALGLDPLVSSQLVTALLGSVAVMFVFVLVQRLWPSTKASLSSAFVLALTGSFVFSAGCTWKETLGLLLTLVMIYAFPFRGQLNHRVLMTLALLFLIFTHHHSTIVAYIIVTFGVVIDHASKTTKPFLDDRAFYDVLTLMVFWAVAVFYYLLIDLPYLDYLSPQTDLYLYLAVAFLFLVVGIRAARRNRPLSKAPIGLAVPIGAAALMGVNYVHPLFPGLPAPSALVFVPMMGYLILVAPAFDGARLALSRRGDAKNLLLAMVLGPVSLITFAFLRGMDATSHLIIYRTFDFLMPALAVFVGLGFAALVKGRKSLGIAVSIAFVVVAASTLPIAYNAKELFGVENQTYWFEYDAFEWWSEHGTGRIASDQRLSDTGWRLFDISGARGLPYDLREGISLEEGRFYALERDWSTSGAQEFPFGTVVVPDEKISSAIEPSDVVYVGGPIGGQLVVFRA